MSGNMPWNLWLWNKILNLKIKLQKIEHKIGKIWKNCAKILQNIEQKIEKKKFRDQPTIDSRFVCSTIITLYVSISLILRFQLKFKMNSERFSVYQNWDSSLIILSTVTVQTVNCTIGDKIQIILFYRNRQQK